MQLSVVQSVEHGDGQPEVPGPLLLLSSSKTSRKLPNLSELHIRNLWHGNNNNS